MEQNDDEAARELALLKTFRDSVIVFHYGVYIDDDDVADSGFKRVMAAAKGLRELRPNGIRALEPLLDDPQPGVQVLAADYLKYDMPDKALPILEHYAKSAELEAGASARAALRAYEDQQKEKQKQKLN